MSEGKEQSVIAPHIIHITSTVDLSLLITPLSDSHPIVDFSDTIDSTFNTTQVPYFWACQKEGDAITRNVSILSLLFPDSSSDSASTILAQNVVSFCDQAKATNNCSISKIVLCLCIPVFGGPKLYGHRGMWHKLCSLYFL